MGHMISPSLIKNTHHAVRGAYPVMRIYPIVSGKRLEMVRQGIDDVIFPERLHGFALVVMAGEGLDDRAALHAGCDHAVTGALICFAARKQNSISAPGQAHIIAALIRPVTDVV